MSERYTLGYDVLDRMRGHALALQGAVARLDEGRGTADDVWLVADTLRALKGVPSRDPRPQAHGGMVDRPLLRVVSEPRETVEPFRAGECWVRFCRLAGEWHCYVCDDEHLKTRVIGVGLGSSPTFALADAHRWMVRHERVLSGAISALERLLEES